MMRLTVDIPIEPVDMGKFRLLELEFLCILTGAAEPAKRQE